jgi:hypothetical protein
MNAMIISTIFGGTYVIGTLLLLYFFGPKKRPPPRD